MSDIITNVKNGQVTDAANARKAYESNGTGAKTAESKASKGTNFDKDMFLKLLAAEMQYQDPMAPTENSQYVSEMATFSQVEATQNVQSAVDDISSGNLIGRYVTVNSDDGTYTGIVDFVNKKDDGIYLGINDREFKLDDVTGIQDAAFYEAKIAASSLNSLLSKVPDAQRFTLNDEENFMVAKTLFDSLSDYAKQFVSQADASKIAALNIKLKELKNN